MGTSVSVSVRDDEEGRLIRKGLKDDYVRFFVIASAMLSEISIAERHSKVTPKGQLQRQALKSALRCLSEDVSAVVPSE